MSVATYSTHTRGDWASEKEKERHMRIKVGGFYLFHSRISSVMEEYIYYKYQNANPQSDISCTFAYHYCCSMFSW